MSSDDDGAGLMASFKRSGQSAAPHRQQASFSPTDFFSDVSSDAENPAMTESSTHTNRRVAIAVRVSPLRDLDEYTYYEPKDEVERIVREFQRKGETLYEVTLSTGQSQKVS